MCRAARLTGRAETPMTPARPPGRHRHGQAESSRVPVPGRGHAVPRATRRGHPRRLRPRRLPGDAVPAVRDLKDQVEGDIVVLGSGDLVRQLAAAGLVDQYVITTVPVVLGRGTRLWGPTYQPLTVARSYTSPTGIVVAT